jgi:uncharacterized protein (TIGR02646 family)
MIKLERKNKPQILKDHEETWKNDLLTSVSKHGSYAAIPKDEKEKLVEPYRHQDIKDPLFESSYKKCAFCEGKPQENGYIEIEHFKPKSLYPQFTFDWLNLLPSCSKCNRTKLAHDTEKEPIVNPYELDPDKVFDYLDIKMIVREGEYEDLGQETIRVCGLNSVRLMKPRSQVLVSLHAFCDDIVSAIAQYESAETERKKTNRLRKIIESIERIENLALASETYSAYCKNYLGKSKSYNKAKGIIAAIHSE